MDARLPVSVCCSAPVIDGKGATHHYNCTKCGKGCCVKSPTQTKEEAEKGK